MNARDEFDNIYDGLVADARKQPLYANNEESALYGYSEGAEHALDTVRILGYRRPSLPTTLTSAVAKKFAHRLLAAATEAEGLALVHQFISESALEGLGRQKSRTIATVEELDALPVGSVILMLDRGYVYERTGDESTFPEDDWASPMHYVLDEDWLPASVLYEPQP